ncbi:hypothetical protein ABEB36_009999 [Hypothenemus hampei]|uniref:Zinc finger CCHC domain-containing protein 4 n=1 Tax=Hypothenemus hampei TaxID=57062 RepID=A0ABD1EI82_HYPHA
MKKHSQKRKLTNTRSSNNLGVSVIIEDLNSHPKCPHGPTLLFSKEIKKIKRTFFGCSACRDRKLCQFFLLKYDKINISKSKLQAWENERIKLLKGINHRKSYILLNKIKALDSNQRTFCITCSEFTLPQEHKDHALINGITDYQLQHPSEILPPLENAKKEAQYLFSKDSVEFIVNTFLKLNYKHVICVGTPRIHEHIQTLNSNLSSILLDFDKRFHNFFGPLEYCWFNMFNNYFFFEEASKVFQDYLKGTGGKDTVLVTDPPFGGRSEPLIYTFSHISNQYKRLAHNELPIFWIFPYFMEPQIVNFSQNFQMLDYKVQYDNHPLFHNGITGRKQGSPVRIFTNVSLSQIALPEPEYKYCRKCNRWVAQENKHCNTCERCPSKNGQTYKHCNLCGKCVKPNWKHCSTCCKCVQTTHSCEKIVFNGMCLFCKETGHKKVDCPNLQESKLIIEKRKRNYNDSAKKKRKNKPVV